MIRTNDASHLYHDSHLAGLSGGALEARQHLRAREVNAREERLLQQQDRQLKLAKDTVGRRCRWEQDSVRRDLRAILERTPTFHTSLRQHKQKLSSQHQWPYCRETNSLVSQSRTRRGQERHSGGHKRAAATLRANALSGTLVAAPKTVCSHGRSRLPPVLTEGADVTKYRPGNSSTITTQQSHALSPDPGKDKTSDAAGHWIQGKPVPRGERYSTPRDTTQIPHSQAATGGEPAALSPPSRAADPRLPPSNINTSQHRGADLRRRSHHAVMAIVRVQARHEQRMREADAAIVAQAADCRRYRFFSEPSQSLEEVSRLLSRKFGDTTDVAPRNRFTKGESPPARFTGDTGSSEARSWIAPPVSQPRRSLAAITEVRRTAHDRPARSRFYSIS